MSVRRERAAARRMIDAFGIRTATDLLDVSGLSGAISRRSSSASGS
jgi:hypothetical protein